MNTNRLKNEKSPYLLAHAHNPVNWFPWGDEALEVSKKEEKPIFLSVGYSTCHWCHVMERESFEDEEVAAYLNKYFISIKVDREERPDLDSIYMDAVQAMTGRGGWPMTVVLTPQLVPFFGGTYFPKFQLLSVLKEVQSIWEKDREKIITSGDNILKHLRSDRITADVEVDLNENILRRGYEQLLQEFDHSNGGFGGAPKFPPGMRLNFLMRVYARTKEKPALNMVEKTLNAMARGGIYDHLGGGFHRYSTDEAWIVPHFEKMLYDNANLAWTYLEAFQITGDRMYSSVAREILDYVRKEMTHKEGGFYSAQDADSEGEEGKFYTWEFQELKKLLDKKELDHLIGMYGVSERGNFEGKNIFTFPQTSNWKLKSNDISGKINKRLLVHRNKRVPPLKDDKVLTAWNGLMIASMAKAYQVLHEDKYLEAAQKAAYFIKEKLYKDKSLLRRYRDGESRFKGNLDDYAYLINGLINLYEADFNEEWITWVIQLQKVQDNLFWDNKEGGYYFSAAGKKNIILRKKDLYDSANPNANAVSALNLMKLFHFSFKKDYKDKAGSIFKLTGKFFKTYPGGLSQMLIALDFYTDNVKEIVLTGDQKELKGSGVLLLIYDTYLPNKVLGFTSSSKRTVIPLLKDKKSLNKEMTVYLCEEGACKYPTDKINEVRELIYERKYYKLKK
ncbi:MAG: thioredoxin domain-containing protein [Spirochaetes bacterium]|nr:thioredoxin domain-containing protein [Spirochaetota bacterium]